MADEEISLRQFIEARLEAFSVSIQGMVQHLSERVNDLRDSIKNLDTKQERQQQQYLDSLARQLSDDKELRREISQIKDNQSVAKGIKCGEDLAEERAKAKNDREHERLWSTEYLKWTKLIAAAAIAGIIAAIVMKYM